MPKTMIYAGILFVALLLSTWGGFAIPQPTAVENKLAKLEEAVTKLKAKVSVLESAYRYDAPILVDGNEQFIGTVVNEQNGLITLLSSQGYAFSLDEDGKIAHKILSFISGTCSGEKYVAKQIGALLPYGFENGTVPGEVFSAGGNGLTVSDELYYVPFNSKTIIISQSYFQTPSSCSFGGEVVAYPVSLNNPSVTDVDRFDYAQPLHLTLPQSY